MQLQDILTKAKYGGTGRFILKLINSRAVSDYAIPALLSFFLSRAVMLSLIAPLGVAMFAAYAKSRRAVISLFAALMGYLTISGEIMIYKYAAALGILFIAAIALGKRKVHPAVMPVFCGAGLFLPGVIFWALIDMSAMSLFTLVSECIGAACAAYFFKLGLLAVRNFRRARTCDMRTLSGFVVLMSSFFFGLMGTEPGAASVGHVAAAAAVLIFSLSGAVSYGALCGLLSGLLLSLSDRDMAGMCVVYSLAAVVCGVFAMMKKSMGALSGFVFMAITLFYFFGAYTAAPLILCAAAATAAALVLPKSALTCIRDAFAPKGRAGQYDKRMRELICDRLWRMSEGYREVCDAVTVASDKLFKTNLNNVSAVFEMAQRRACRSCELVHLCWQTNYSRTMDALNSVSGELSKKKTVYPEDFPPHFRASCVHMDLFTESVNDAYRDWLMRRKLAQKQRQTRRLAIEQYSSLSRAMDSVAREFSDEITFNIHAEERIISYLHHIKIQPKSVIVMEQSGGRVAAEMDFDEGEPLCMDRETLRREVSLICGAPMSRISVTRREGVMRIAMSVPEPLTPSYAHFGTTRDGETDSGDVADAFKTDRGKLVLQMCDGMGSGRRAALDSSIAVGVVRRIISAGFDNDTAVSVLNSAMLLKSDDESVTGIDIAVLDLFTGRCEFLKLGAAPTYIFHDGHVTRVDSSAPPIGVLEEARMSKSVMTLYKGDIIVMVSDGVISSGDAFLCDMLERFEFKDAYELAGEIVRRARVSSGNTALDDMSALVCLI